MLSLFQTIRSLMFIRTNEMLMKVNNPLFGTIQVTFTKETWPSYLIFCQRFKSKFGQSLLRTRQKSRKEKFSKNEIRKLSYLELDDVLQGLGVLEVLLRGLVCVADVDVVLVEVEVEVTSDHFVVNRWLSINLNKIKMKSNYKLMLLK